MFQLLKNVTSGYTEYMIKLGRIRVREVLLNHNTRELEDMGISRHLLIQGVDAWPWREGYVPASPAKASIRPAAISKREQKRAIRQLRSMSNAELSDMGISRGAIADAVINGRPADSENVSTKRAA